jgi:hypothetical protein
LLPRVGLASGLPVGQHPTIGQRTWGVAADRTRWRGGIGARFRGWGIGSGGANGKKVDRNTWAAGDEENRAGGGAVGTGSCGAGGYGSLPRGVYNIPIYTHTHIYIYI